MEKKAGGVFKVGVKESLVVPNLIIVEQNFLNKKRSIKFWTL